MLKKIFTKKRGKAGFTLIELLVTIVIVGIISVTTFAIVVSAMNTFKRQQDIVDGNDIKELISITVKEYLRKRSNIFLMNENLAPTISAEGQSQASYGESCNDAAGYYVLDPRVMDHHMMYCDKGRIYTVTSNLEGKYYVDRLYEASEHYANPKSTKGIKIPITKPAPGGPTELDLNGDMGRQELMAESLYDKYFVDIKFKPIYTNVQGRYRDLQLVIYIYDDVAMTEEHLVTWGTETFHMLNVENRQTEIKFQNKIKDNEEHPENMKKPSKEGYRICYFS